MNPNTNPFDAIVNQLNDHRRSDFAVQALKMLAPSLRLIAPTGPARPSAITALRTLEKSPLREQMIRLTNSLAGLDYIYDGTDKVLSSLIPYTGPSQNVNLQLDRSYTSEAADFEVINERPDLVTTTTNLIQFAKDQVFTLFGINSNASLPPGDFAFNIRFEHPDYTELVLPITVST